MSPSTPATPAVQIAHPPAAASLTHGSGSDLSVTWTTPAVDGTHSAATGFNLRSSPSGAGVWTTVTNVASPHDLSGLAAGVAIDVELQSSNSAGTSAWSSASTLTTASAGPNAPNVPAITSVAPSPDGTAGNLVAGWTPPAADGSHGAATGYNLRFGPTGAGTWTTVTSVMSPYTLTGLTGGAAVDVEVQATNAAASPGAWSAVTTATPWGATIVPGTWIPAVTQVHNVAVSPNGGVNMVITAAPTAVTGAEFGWSASASTIPSSGLIATTPDGQPNGFGQWFTAPATAGTFYLWTLAQGAGGTTIGVLVSPAITVS
jgi:hypothetical protein